MILRRFYDEKLAAASYMVGCATTGEALIVDPLRLVEPYLAAAKAEGLRLTHVTETHIHADFVSGLRELATRTGARAYLSGEGGPDWRYEFADEIGAELVHDGDVIQVGNIRLQVLHTPGHTPEHLVFLVTDTRGADKPMGAFTGDFLFVGDVGRPDLLETAAGVHGTMESGARDLYRSIQRFRELAPDYVQVWPGHGAGSACGKALGAVPQSTVGYEKLFNPMLGYEDEDGFVRAVLEGQPEPPSYFARMKVLNREGPPLLGEPEPLERLPDARLPALVAGGELVVDVRPRAEFIAAHVRGTIAVPLTRSFTTYAGSVLPWDRDIYLIGDAAAAESARRDLALIGYDRIRGRFDPAAVAADSAEPLAEVDADELADRLARGELEVVDVRGLAEWKEGHVPGARHVPMGDLARRLDELPRDRTLALQCRTGARSTIAASLLRARGFDRVVNAAGGILAWHRTKHPVERDGD